MRELVHTRDGVLREGPPGDAEDLVTDGEARDARANCFHRASHVQTGHAVLRPANPEADAKQVGLPGHQVNVTSADAGRVHAEQHLTSPGRGLVDVAELQHVGRAVTVLNDCLHGGHVISSSAV